MGPSLTTKYQRTSQVRCVLLLWPAFCLLSSRFLEFYTASCSVASFQTPANWFLVVVLLYGRAWDRREQGPEETITILRTTSSFCLLHTTESLKRGGNGCTRGIIEIILLFVRRMCAWVADYKAQFEGSIDDNFQYVFFVCARTVKILRERFRVLKAHTKKLNVLGVRILEFSTFFYRWRLLAPKKAHIHGKLLQGVIHHVYFEIKHDVRFRVGNFEHSFCSVCISPYKDAGRNSTNLWFLETSYPLIKVMQESANSNTSTPLSA